MGRSEVESRVTAAMAALTKDKKTTVRDLAKAIDHVSSCTVKVAKINQERDQAIKDALEALEAAKAAGWTSSDLEGAGLTVPRSIPIELPEGTELPEPRARKVASAPEPTPAPSDETQHEDAAAS